MQITTLSTALNLPDQALLFDLDELYAVLRRIKDRRGKQGRQYPLAEILLIGVLAKLAGQTSSRSLAEWAKLRSQELQRLFHLRHEKMPHYSTWSRIMGQAIDPEELERALGQFFGQQLSAATQPGERHLCLDGKTLRGTIPLGKRKARASGFRPTCHKKEWCWPRCKSRRWAMRSARLLSCLPRLICEERWSVEMPTSRPALSARRSYRPKGTIGWRDQREPRRDVSGHSPPL